MLSPAVLDWPGLAGWHNVDMLRHDTLRPGFLTDCMEWTGVRSEIPELADLSLT